MGDQSDRCPFVTDSTNAERQRRWWARQTGALPPAERIPCSSCGRIHTGARGILCSRCWAKTPEGKEFNRQRQKAFRVRQKLNGH